MKTAEERFFNKVQKSNGCWEWIGFKNKGYGQFNVGNKIRVLAHRFSYGLIKGQIPAGLHIDHLCRNRSCVKPEHLEIVTQSENNSRAWKVNRKNTCPKGHDFIVENTRQQADGRICIICKKEKNKIWYQNKKRLSHGMGAPVFGPAV